MPYKLPNQQYPYPLSYLASDGGTVTETFVENDPTVSGTDPNWFVWCLTPQQMVDVLSIFEVGAPIAFPDTYNTYNQLIMQLREFPNEIPENSCMDLCQLIIDCIDNTPALQQKIGEYSPTSSLIDDSILDPTNLGTELISDLAGCDNDIVFGQTTGIVELLNSIATDMFEIISANASVSGRIGDVIEAIPGVGVLPIDDIFQFVESFLDDLGGLYASKYTVSLKNTMRCDLFCIGQDNCELTLEQVRDYLYDNIGFTFSTTDWVTNVQNMMDETYIDAQIVYVTHYMIVDAMIRTGIVLGFDVGRVVQVIQSMLNDPDSDWTTICDDCDWQWVSDFANDENIWTPQQNPTYAIQATWTDTIGYETVDDLVASGDYSRILGIETSEFPPTEIIDIELDYDYTKGTFTNGTIYALTIAAVKNDDTTVRLDIQNSAMVNGTGKTHKLTVNETDIKSMRFFIRSSSNVSASYSGSLTLNDVTVNGVGSNPFTP